MFVSLKVTLIIIYSPFFSDLKIESLYPNLHSIFVNVSISSVKRLTASQLMKLSLSSTPYAPIFCMGDAPTSPGISDRFSTPERLLFI